MTQVRFRLLGPLEAAAGEHVLSLGGTKQRALLAVLLLHPNELVSRDRLIDELWGSRAPPGAAHNLEVYVSRLRKALRANGEAGTPLQTRPGGYLLRLEPGQLDVEEFESLLARGRQSLAEGDPAGAVDALDEARALWHGEPLADLAFEPFAQAEIERLGELRLAALELRIDALLELGRHAGVLSELEVLVAREPLREALRGQLMLALYRSGRQADALEVYRQSREALVEELGLEPGQALQQLEQAILRQDPRLELPSEAAEPMDGSEERPRNGRRRSVLIGAIGTTVAVAVTVPMLVLGAGGSGDSGLSSVGGDALGAIDPRTGHIVEAIEVDARPSRVAASAEAIWVVSAARGTVSRVDPAEHSVVREIHVGNGPAGIAVGGGGIWVANTLDGTVARVDATTNTLVDTIPVGSGPRGVAFGGGSIWVANHDDGTVTRIDARSGKRLRTITVGPTPTGIAADQDAAWVTDESTASVWLIDARTNDAAQWTHVGNGPNAIAIGAGAVWVANTLDGTLWKISPSRRAVLAVIPVGDGPTGVAVARGSVWVANTYSGTVTRVDPRANMVVRTVTTGNRPIDIGAQGDSLWVAIAPSGASHRGGTLKLVAEVNAESFDPGFASRYDSSRYLIMTGDGLTALQKVGGAEGTTLVPDLATALQAPSNSGRTYAFTLRTGLRYSNGAPVRATDFRRAFERVLAGDSQWASSFAGIVGAAGCWRSPGPCDLSHGVVTDDAARTIVFHLREPDAEFLYKLALPAAFPVPAGTPRRNVGTTRPIAGTGPYMIARYAPLPAHPSPRARGELVFVRNPYFREWSRAAQPAGFPDRIVLRIGLSVDAQLNAIKQGHADATTFLPGPYRVNELATRYPVQLHTNPHAGIFGISMNMVAPFGDVNVRRALAYAIDRPRLLAILGGPRVARSTCQVQPPNFPGFSRYCPFSRNLAKAKRLVRASGTSGMRVTVWTVNTSPFSAIARQVARTLNALGYRASARLTTWKRHQEVISGKAPTIQIFTMGVDFDNVVASDLLKGFSCAANRAGPAASIGFCDETVDAAITRALRVQVTNPQAANELWARVDRLVVDRAPWIPISNGTWIDFVSKRVGNYQYHPQYAMLIDQVWLR